MFLGDVFDKLLHAWSYRQHLPQRGLGILGQEQVGVIATNFLKLSHKLFVIFVWRKRRAIAAPAQATFCAVPIRDANSGRAWLDPRTSWMP